MTATLTRRRALALGGGLALGASLGLRAGANSTEFRIGYQKGGVVALLKGTGQLEEVLKPQGISVTWSEFTSGPPLLEALGAGALDFGHTGDVPPLFALAARQDVVFVGTYAGSATGSAILVPKDSPIQTLADLKGKKLAFKRGSSAHNVTLQLLRTAGLTLDDITAVDLGPQDAAPAFAQGAVDAWSIWDPYTVATEQTGARVIATASGVVPSFSFLLANGEYAKANGPVLSTVIDTLRKTGEAAEADLDGTVKAISAATGLSPEVVKAAAERPDLDYSAVKAITPEAIAYEQGLADTFFDIGIIPRKVDIAAAVWTPSA